MSARKEYFQTLLNLFESHIEATDERKEYELEEQILTLAMNALFEIGQKVVCIDSAGEFDDDSKLDLIEGKTYVVARYYKRESVFGVMLVGCKGAYDQNRFIPPNTDKELENEIHEALKGVKIEKL